MDFSRDGSMLANTTVDERGFAIRIRDWPSGIETLKLRDSGFRVALSHGRPLAGGARGSRRRSCACGGSTRTSSSGSRVAASPAH